MSFYTEDRILFYKNCPFSLDSFLVGLGEVGGGSLWMRIGLMGDEIGERGGLEGDFAWCQIW